MSMGIRGRGVPCGRKWARDDFVLCRKPRITVPVHKGIAMARFIDSCVVGVNVWGRSPRRFVDPINRMSEISIRDHVRPFGE